KVPVSTDLGVASRPVVEQSNVNVVEKPVPTTVATSVVEEPSLVDEPVEEPVVAPPSLRERLGKTRALFATSLQRIRGNSAVDDATFDELEEVLIRADVGLST